MWRTTKAKLQCRSHWIRENMTVLDTWRLCKVLNIIFLVILGPTVSTNTYLWYIGSVLPPLFTATPPPPHPYLLWTNTTSILFSYYLSVSWSLPHHESPKSSCRLCAFPPFFRPSFLLPPSSLLLPSFPPSIRPTSLSFFLLSAKMLVLAGPSTFWVWTKTGQNLVLGWCTFKYLPCIIPSPYLSFNGVVTPGADMF